jgi:hypothetical protein
MTGRTSAAKHRFDHLNFCDCSTLRIDHTRPGLCAACRGSSIAERARERRYPSQRAVLLSSCPELPRPRIMENKRKAGGTNGAGGDGDNTRAAKRRRMPDVSREAHLLESQTRLLLCVE